MQNLHKRRLGTDAKYQAHMKELYSQFTALIANFRTLASDVVRKRGGIIFEWPTSNKLWQEVAVQDMIKELGLQKG